MTRPLLTTSWDDGTPEDLELGHLLARYGYRGTFYATTGPRGFRTIDDAGLEKLVRLGHELGNHGRSHRRFVELSRDELLEETDWAESEIRRFASPSVVVAPPRGAVNRRVIRTLNTRGLTVRTAPILGGRRASPGTMVPTAQVYPHTTTRTFLHLVRRRSLPAIPFLRAWSRSTTIRGRLRGIADAAEGCSTSVHIWGHSQEIDRLGLWRDLELFLEAAAEHRFRPATNGQLAPLGGRTE
jgi:hypothetical protein